MNTVNKSTCLTSSTSFNNLSISVSIEPLLLFLCFTRDSQERVLRSSANSGGSYERRKNKKRVLRVLKYVLTISPRFLHWQIPEPLRNVRPNGGHHESRASCICPYRNLSQLVRSSLPVKICGNSQNVFANMITVKSLENVYFLEIF